MAERSRDITLSYEAAAAIHNLTSGEVGSSPTRTYRASSETSGQTMRCAGVSALENPVGGSSGGVNGLVSSSRAACGMGILESAAERA